jgi:ATP-binding cassette subfamily B protein
MLFPRFRAWFSDPASDGWIVRRLLVEYGYSQVKPYLAALVMGAIAAASTAATAYVVGNVVNEAYITRNFWAIAGLAVFVIVIFAIKGLAIYGANVVMARIGYQIMADLQHRLFDKLLIEGLGYFADRHSTQLLVKITRGVRSAAGVLRTLVNVVSRDLLTLIGLVTVMVIQDPIMSLLGFITLPPAIFFVRDLVRRTRNLERSEFKTGMRIFETIQETIRGFPVVKAFTLEQEMRERIKGSLAGALKKQIALARIENRASPVMESLGGVAIALVLLYGAYRVIVLGATPGEFVSFITAFLLAYEPAKRLARVNIDLARNLLAVRRLYTLLDSPPLEPEEPETRPVRIERGEIRFADVEFAYKRRVPVLRKVSFLAEAGKMTAFVGHSGGGKSTLVSLILRFYDPQAGSIEVDGINIADIPRRALRRHIAFVGQDIFLFNATIRENIAYGKLGASEGEIVAAARAAYAHDFIAAFPEGYDTEVGETGTLLSSGQRQRIAVARALIRNAPIILLDEATSSLDSQAEREVQRAIDHLREGRTCIAIAHRLHTIMQADRIHVLEDGRIIESGTHLELMRRNGRYADMFRIQAAEDDEGEEERPAAVGM